MNERIEDLMYQAGLTAQGCWDELGTYEQEAIEKFAELIVRECAELIDNKEMITAAQTYDEVFVTKYDTKEQCARQIKDYFGVEE